MARKKSSMKRMGTSKGSMPIDSPLKAGIAKRGKGRKGKR